MLVIVRRCNWNVLYVAYVSRRKRVKETLGETGREKKRDAHR